MINNNDRKTESEFALLDHEICKTRECINQLRLQSAKVAALREKYNEKTKHHLSSLSKTFQREVKNEGHVQSYRKELIRLYGKDVPMPYLLLLQAKLLRCFHLTEIFRYQWKIAADNCIRTTQSMLQQELVLKHIQTPDVVKPLEQREITVHPQKDTDFSVENLRHFINYLAKSMRRKEPIFGTASTSMIQEWKHLMKSSTLTSRDA